VEGLAARDEALLFLQPPFNRVTPLLVPCKAKFPQVIEEQQPTNAQYCSAQDVPNI
jgi:hypothetical protein